MSALESRGSCGEKALLREVVTYVGGQREVALLAPSWVNLPCKFQQPPGSGGFDSVCRQRKAAKRPYLGRGDTLLRLGGLGGLGLGRAHSLLLKWCLCCSDYGSSWLPPHQGQKLRTLNMFSFFPFA